MMRSSLLLLFVFLTSLLQAQHVDLEKLDNYFEKALADWGTPGMSVAVVKDGETVFSKGYGLMEVGEDKQPDGNSLYAIASNSKAFTSYIIAQLVDEGKLDWDDKVKKYLPYFELYDPWVSNEVTIKDLLCHRVGLGTFSGDVIWYKSDLTSEEIIRRIKYLEPAYDFRDGFGYSNVMFITAGEVIKQVTGKTWGQNVQERILDPVGMDRTVFSLSELDAVGNYATPHAFEEGENIPISYTDWEEVGALGGLISSVKDMAKWMSFMMSSESIAKNQLWKMQNSYAVNRNDRNDFNMHFSGYGLGWGLSDYYGRLRVSHTGGYDGMISAVTMIPDEKLGVVVLSNGMNPPAMAVTYYALNAFLDEEEKDWSAEMLKKKLERKTKDTRVDDRMASRVEGTTPSLELEKYTGTYKAAIYGNIDVKLEDGALRMYFEHSPELSATLEHWHYDVWKLDWDNTHAWFNFGTVKFNMDNNLKITGMEFDVPNDDIFFEELKPVRTE
ncbi:serine hydrolase [Maribellus sediminis]|uniref:serine hydrolase n=1 Tax=Maribellus sediminis TaxID=2696285 RepID=UPI001F117521|nr:serine hydrolase [Maribellus sediminis]